MCHKLRFGNFSILFLLNLHYFNRHGIVSETLEWNILYVLRDTIIISAV